MLILLQQGWNWRVAAEIKYITGKRIIQEDFIHLWYIQRKKENVRNLKSKENLFKNKNAKKRRKNRQNKKRKKNKKKIQKKSKKE